MVAPQSPEADILADLAGRTHKPRSTCWLTRLRIANPDLAKQAELGIASKHSATRVADWLNEHGAGPVSYQIVTKHRAGTCVSCRTS